ncbi:MerR family transcriptional regulator [Marivivens donghaensis]|uniref:MerR family transcriptional regulator n=1 Tax=Marivivens donghaensis TaxID=1699413 RepID=A0ABX0VVQ6_9RHOB|nr:MerR family transcriptional regulator [Marivivens donghaensis]NIY71899.1 MerR family transcriptional regulator [Marivivens donghaensis]
MERKYFDPERIYDDNDVELDLIAPKSKRAQWRHKGVGPAYLCFGRRIKYDGHDLNSWVNSVRVSTSEAA